MLHKYTNATHIQPPTDDVCLFRLRKHTAGRQAIGLVLKVVDIATLSLAVSVTNNSLSWTVLWPGLSLRFASLRARLTLSLVEIYCHPETQTRIHTIFYITLCPCLRRSRHKAVKIYLTIPYYCISHHSLIVCDRHHLLSPNNSQPHQQGCRPPFARHKLNQWISIRAYLIDRLMAACSSQPAL